MKKDSTPEETEKSLEALEPRILDWIEARSKAGQLVMAEEVYAEFLRTGILREDGNTIIEFDAFLKRMVTQNENLKEIKDGQGLPYYYSTRSMAETYAQLIVRRGQDPWVFMAEVIRENSQRYPRPVPVNLFSDSPFSLTQEEITACLKELASLREYQDIQQTITSAGSIFLYSRQYLDTEYATMLAEWLDVGQLNSP